MRRRLKVLIRSGSALMMLPVIRNYFANAPSAGQSDISLSPPGLIMGRAPVTECHQHLAPGPPSHRGCVITTTTTQARCHQHEERRKNQSAILRFRCHGYDCLLWINVTVIL